MGRKKGGCVKKRVRKNMNLMYLSWLQTHVEKENGGNILEMMATNP